MRGDEKVLPEGTMAALISGLDASSCPLGAPAVWPDHLRTTLDVMLPAQAQIVLFWGPHYVSFYNDAYAAVIGDKHPRALGEPARETWTELWDDLEPLLRGVRETGKAVFAKDRAFCIERHGYPEDVWFDISYSAVRDRSGKVDGVLCIVSETTERVLSQRKLRLSEDRLSRALRAAGMIGTFDWNVDANTFHADDRLTMMLSHYAGKAFKGERFAEHLAVVHPDDIDRIAEAIDRCVTAGQPFREEYRIRGQNGSTRWIDVRAKRSLSDDGRHRRFCGVAVDITDRKEARQHEQLMLREMNHRVKNLLTVMDALIAMSARSAQTVREMASSLRGRLRALMEAKELIRPGMIGIRAERPKQTTMDALVSTILLPYRDEGSRDRPRIIALGPEIALGENATTNLALILHECATNALKYGALSTSDGELRIEWSVRGDDLDFVWRESGGPAVAVTSDSRGFGSVLIEQSIKDLKGSIVYENDAEGLAFRLTLSVGDLANEGA